MKTQLSLFDTHDGETLLPLPSAGSGWGDQLRGIAVSGALARGAERALLALGRPELRPVRWTCDLMAPVRCSALNVDTRVIREGRKLVLIEANLVQDDRVRSRATALFLRPGGEVDGLAWRSDAAYSRPPEGLPPLASESRWYYSEGVGWAAGTQVHQLASPKRSWHREIMVVEGETPTPFQFVAAIADVTNVVANWGTAGLEYINADLTVSLVRLPESLEAGLAVFDRVEGAGVSIGTAHLFDDAGVFGNVTVSGLVSGVVADPGALDRRHGDVRRDGAAARNPQTLSR